MNAYFEAVAQLPEELSDLLCKIPRQVAQEVTEIRIRSGRPLCLSTAQGAQLVSKTGGIAKSLSDGFFVSHELTGKCFHAVCSYSIHSFEQAIANGFIPLRGGHRVGICGTAIYGQLFSVKNITGLNIRVARTKLVNCPSILKRILCEPFVGLLIAGAPSSGKTTLLRAVIQELSAQNKKTAVVDERFELVPIETKGFSSVPPLHCDVLSGYPKHIGMQHALRGLGPDVLVCDEVGAMEDVQAIESAANAGVGMVASIHAQTKEMLARRPQYKMLLQTGAFTKVAFLKGSDVPGTLSEVCDALDFM